MHTDLIMDDAGTRVLAVLALQATSAEMLNKFSEDETLQQLQVCNVCMRVCMFVCVCV